MLLHQTISTPESPVLQHETAALGGTSGILKVGKQIMNATQMRLKDLTPGGALLLAITVLIGISVATVVAIQMLLR